MFFTNRSEFDCMEYVTAHSVDIPALGFGTWKLRGKACRTAVEHALDLGYRHLDTAQMYNNETEVGAAIANSSVDRDDVFLVTKVLRRNLAYDDVLRSVEKSLERLGTQIDLLLIHSPSKTVPIDESIEAMNYLQHDGTVDHIGVSNFSVQQLQEAIDVSETPILANQVEYHPLKSQDELLEFCIDNDIMLTAYSPLAKQRVLGNEVLQEIGETYGKSEVQVALRWLIQQEMVSAIPKAATDEHQKKNLEIFDFELTAADMKRIFELQGGLLTRLRHRLGL
jgi:diketogulonate reductase-like aldo/keto reductase